MTVDFTSVEGSRFKSNPEQLLNNVEFESILNKEIIFLNFIIVEYEWMIKLYENIVKLIDQELVTYS